jgi:hypothetical protein
MSLTNSQINNPSGYGITVNTSGADVIIENNVITGCGSQGIYMQRFLLGALTFQNNTISGSQSGSINLNLTSYNPTTLVGGLESNMLEDTICISGTMQCDLTLPKRTYLVTNNLIVSSGLTLTWNQERFLRRIKPIRLQPNNSKWYDERSRTLSEPILMTHKPIRITVEQTDLLAGITVAVQAR